ncbi:hypothetical protein FO519_008626 [Halicephalobus sp. NKZ332]|nr:hypothetical protein FO519_008626 [Halicephalobus sp. NKZ332]
MVQNNTFCRKLTLAIGQVVVCTVIVIWFIQGSLNNPKPIIVEKLLEIQEFKNNKEVESPNEVKSPEAVENPQQSEISKEDSESSVVQKFRKCSRSANFKSETDKEFIPEYRACVESSIPELQWEKFKMGRFGENKVFIPMKSEFDENKCNWITVGIGGDSQVEKLFHERYPGCKIFGVEASEDQYAEFKSYGTVIPYGVGVENGTFKLTVREGKNYYKKEVQVLAMSNLLDKYLGTRKVQYMTIDIEGFEYFILEALIGGQKLAEEGVVFCQIDAELHHQTGKDTHLKEFLKKFDSDESDYLPIFTSPFLGHQKVTFLNFKDPECAKAFNTQPFI